MNETALKARLKNIARETATTFNATWKQLILERFLARLSRSEHHDKFIFKGGLLLAQYLTIGRETVDADFLIRKLKHAAPVIEASVKAIIAAPHSDGFIFEWDRMEMLNQPHMDYTGFRISLRVTFGKMNDKIHLDIGFGDEVIEQNKIFQRFEYRGQALFDGEITLRVYPPETIFAEKLETIIRKGAVNSRMKDYHDVLLLTREPGMLDPTTLIASVNATFSTRNTALKLPLSFDDAGLRSLQTLWMNHLNGLGTFKVTLNLPDEISALIAELNQWLEKIFF